MQHWRKLLAALALTALLFGGLNAGTTTHHTTPSQITAGDNPAGGAGSGRT